MKRRVITLVSTIILVGLTTAFFPLDKDSTECDNLSHESRKSTAIRRMKSLGDNQYNIQRVKSLNSPSRPQVGAIRWDAWIGDIGKGPQGATPVGLQVERSLSPHKYHYRAPFYSKVISNDSIQCRGTSQEIMDQEISYAKHAGIDYWAFCWYPPHSGLDTARQLYLASKHSVDIKWCLILGTNPFDFNRDAKWLVAEFKKSNYEKVLDGRPLIYVFSSAAIKGGNMQSLIELAIGEGVKKPYIAFMTQSEKDLPQADSLHADALSAYISWAGKNGEPYFPVIPKADSTGWENHKATGRKVIPWVTSGHNTKPRIDHPVSWTKVPADNWVEDGSPEQIADHLASCISWVGKNRCVDEANCVLIYAWNEFDEGGWICPTLGNNTSRLDAIEKVLMKGRKID